MKRKIILVLMGVTLLLNSTGCNALNAGNTQIQSETESEVLTKNVFTEWLPSQVQQIQAETEPNDALKETIIDYYDIPEEGLEQTRYYYNYVDLNGDGTDEMFVVILGMYTSGTGGSSALWCSEVKGQVEILQAFSLVNTPIIITKDPINSQQFGAKGLIMQRSGGGVEAEIVQLTYSDGIYTNVADAKPIANIGEIEGTAIICNDLIKDMENGKALTLAD